MLLAIDLGNTNLAFGLFEGDALRHDWRLATRRDSMPDELGLLMVQLIRQDVIGRTTAESMQAGIIFGFTAQVEGMVARIKKELGENPRVIATGGLAGLIAAETPVIELVDQRLMLEGLRLIYDLNA